MTQPEDDEKKNSRKWQRKARANKSVGQKEVAPGQSSGKNGGPVLAEEPANGLCKECSQFQLCSEGLKVGGSLAREALQELYRNRNTIQVSKHKA